MGREAIVRTQVCDGAVAGPDDTTGITGEIEALSHLIGAIYEAALDPTLWPGVCAEIGRFVGARPPLLISGDAARKAANQFDGEDGIGGHDIQLCFDERDGIINAETRRRVQLIAPHVRRATSIGEAIRVKTAEAAALADTLDGIAAATFVVNPSGHIAFANAAGHDMLAQGDMLRAPNGWLAASDAKADQALREAFTDADAVTGTKGTAVPLIARDGVHHVAHVLPLDPGARRHRRTAHPAVATLLVQKAALARPARPEAIARSYRLTAAELRVLLAIAEIGGVPEVAEALGIGETTVKSHLKRLFAKSGAKRQADLVKIVAAFSSPLK